MRHVRRHAQREAVRGTKHMKSIRDKVPSITEQQIKELVLKPSSILLCLFCIELFTLFPFGSRDID